MWGNPYFPVSRKNTRAGNGQGSFMPMPHAPPPPPAAAAAAHLPSLRCTSFLVSTISALTTWPCEWQQRGEGKQGSTKVSAETVSSSSAAAAAVAAADAAAVAAADAVHHTGAHLRNFAPDGLLDRAGDDVADGGVAAARLDALHLLGATVIGDYEPAAVYYHPEDYRRELTHVQGYKSAGGRHAVQAGGARFRHEKCATSSTLPQSVHISSFPLELCLSCRLALRRCRLSRPPLEVEAAGHGLEVGGNAVVCGAQRSGSNRVGRAGIGLANA